MKSSRQDIVELLQRGADATTPPIDPVFVEQLDRRLRSIDLSKDVPRRRRVGRVSLIAVAAITATAGVAAAAAGVITRHNSPTQPPATQPIGTVAITTPESTTSPSIVLPVTTTTSVASGTSITSVTSVAPTTTTATVPLIPTTVLVTTAPASTEVRVPATLTLVCTPAGSAINCSWDAGPAGTTHYALLRTDSASTQGRVFTPEPGSTTYVDTVVAPGITYVYLVHALDDTEHSIAHSDSSSTACCG